MNISTFSPDKIFLSHSLTIDPKLDSSVPTLVSSMNSSYDDAICYPLEIKFQLCENFPEIRFNCSFSSTSIPFRNREPFDVLRIIQLLATCIICVIGVLGNLLVVIAMPSDTSSRSPISYFLINLSIADILISSFCPWQNILRNLYYNYMLGYLGCKAGSFIHMTCLFVSVFTLVGIAIDRVYAVLLPLKARLTNPSPKWTLLVVWILGLTAAVPFCVLKDYRVYKWNDFTEIQCVYNVGKGHFDPERNPPCQRGENYVNTYHFIVTILLYFLPVLIMILAYVMIIIRLWRTSNFIGDSRLISRAHFNAKKRAVLLALVVLAAFLLCWTPLQIFLLNSIFGDDFPEEALKDKHTFWIFFFAYCNSCLNPMIYGGFSKSYRAALMKVFKKDKKKSRFSTLFGRSRGTGTVSFSVPKSECLPLRQKLSKASVHFSSNGATHPKKAAKPVPDDLTIDYHNGRRELLPSQHQQNVLTATPPDEDDATKLVSTSDINPMRIVNYHDFIQSSSF